MFSNLVKVIKSNGTEGDRRCLPRSIIIMAVIIVLHMLPAVWVSSESLEDVLDRSSYNISQKEAIHELFQGATEEAVPEEMLLPRLTEGIAKRMPAIKVLSALKQNLNNIREARFILLGVSGGALLVEKQRFWLRTANLLAGGVPSEDIREIAEACWLRQEDYRQATSLHVSLMDWGLERRVSLDLVRAFLDSNISGESFDGVPGLLAAGRRLRISTEELVLRIRKELPEVGTFEELQEFILY